MKERNNKMSRTDELKKLSEGDNEMNKMDEFKMLFGVVLDKLNTLTDEVVSLKKEIHTLREENKELKMLEQKKKIEAEIPYFLGAMCKHYDTLSVSSEFEMTADMKKAFDRFDELIETHYRNVYKNECDGFIDTVKNIDTWDLDEWGEVIRVCNTDYYCPSIRECLDNAEEIFNDYKYHSVKGTEILVELEEDFLIAKDDVEMDLFDKGE